MSISQRVTLPATPAPLWGWADLHTHPMSNLAFGGKLFHGAPDVGSLMPAVQMSYDPQCRFDDRAININEALSDDAPTHGDPLQSKCGDFARNAAVQALETFNDAIRQPGHAVGYPTFVNWPRWNDITHQKMWVDWIRRAKDGGLRVMVALSHNNRSLAEVIGAGGPISGVKDDNASSDLQISEIKAFVGAAPGSDEGRADRRRPLPDRQRREDRHPAGRRARQHRQLQRPVAVSPSRRLKPRSTASTRRACDTSSRSI